MNYPLRVEIYVPIALWLGLLMHIFAVRMCAPRCNSGKCIFRKAHRIVGCLSLAALPVSFLAPSQLTQLTNAILLGLLGMLVVLLVLQRSALHGFQRVDEIFVDVALLHFVGGLIWLAATILGYSLLGFGWPWNALTATHFIYAAHLFPLLLAISTRTTPLDSLWTRRLQGLALALYYVGFWNVALNIHKGEIFAVTAVLALLLAVILWFSTTRPQRGRKALPAFFILSLFCFTMFKAFQFSYGISSIDEMLLQHGIPNALLLLPLAFYLVGKSQPHVPAQDFPLSRAVANSPVKNWVEQFAMPSSPAQGFVSDFAVFESPECKVAKLSPRIRDFYENTLAYSMKVQAAWRKPFDRIWICALPRFTRWGQFALTINDENLTSKIECVKLPGDSRPNVRAWCRWEPQSNRSMYVATYSTHRDDRRIYMNIGFPLPFGTVSSILRLATIDESLELTSLPRPTESGDEGVYFARGRLRMRLPLNETILVSLLGREENSLRAEHQMWFFGMHFLTLFYEMRRES